MPTPQIKRINPLDLQGNIAIGVSLPFNGPIAFKSTYSTKEQIKSNLINLLLTNKNERIMNPKFGANLRTVLFEGINEDTSELIRSLIFNSVSNYIPEITIVQLDIIDKKDENSIYINLEYRINISGINDQITLQFT